VCENESGNTKFFRCWYHGWTYDSTGALLEVTGKDAYGDRLDMKEMGLSQVPRIGSYRGFVFASLAKEGESLEAFLGNAAPIIDLLVDASPTSTIHADGGSHKTVYRGNWKYVGMDGYHPHYVHASVFASMKRNPDAGIGATHREDPFEDKARTRTVDFGHGHAMLDFRQHRINHYKPHTEYLKKIEGGTAYIEAMHKAHGDERARMLICLGGDPHLGIFPNMQLIGNQIRIITPLAPDLTQVTMTAVRLGGVSEEMNATRLRQHESFYGPAGAGSPDDAEIFERVQRGMAAEVNPWVEISRGMDREQTDTDGNTVGLISDEVPQRGIMRYWSELMSQSS
jgi:phenylpropionate dioxygenase-like ring-hydroxylating dioxygenase large terminal subunit